MHDDESQRRVVAPRVRRLVSPAGLVLAGLCLLLPFMSASCDSEQQSVRWHVTYTGVDVLVGGRPAVDFTDDVNREPIHRLDDVEVKKVLGELPARLPRQPVAWLAAALMLAALAATALSSRIWRAAATAGLALAAAIVWSGATILARQDATDAVAAALSRIGATSSAPPTTAQLRQWEHYSQVRDAFHYAYGLWLAIAAMSGVAVANIVRLVREPNHETPSGAEEGT